MKQTVLALIAFLILPVWINAQENGIGENDKGIAKVKWYSVKKAQELNEKNPRKILIDVYTDWCGWCKKMDQNTFSHPEIAKYLNEKYYPVKFNAESTEPVVFNGQRFENKGEGRRATHQLAIHLLNGKMAYPSIAYLNEDYQLLSPVPGYYTPAQLEPIIKFFGEEVYKKQSWEEYKTTFQGEID